MSLANTIGLLAGVASAPFWDKNEIGYEGDTYSANPYELVVLGGIKIPGRSTVEALPERLFDRQKVKNHDGVSLVLRGYLPGPITVDTMIWTPDQWRATQLLFAQHWPKPGKLADTVKKGTTGSAADLADQAALSIEHPMLHVLGVQRVVIKGINVPKPGQIPGTWEFSFKCLEAVPNSKKVTATKIGGVAAPPYAAVPGAKNGTGGDIDPPSKNSGGPFGPPPRMGG